MKRFLEWATKFEQRGKGAFATPDQQRILQRFGFEFDSLEKGDPSVGIFGDVEVWFKAGAVETVFLAFDDNTWRLEQNDREVGSGTMQDLGSLRRALV